MSRVLDLVDVKPQSIWYLSGSGVSAYVFTGIVRVKRFRKVSLESVYTWMESSGSKTEHHPPRLSQDHLITKNERSHLVRKRSHSSSESDILILLTSKPSSFIHSPTSHRYLCERNPKPIHSSMPLSHRQFHLYHLTKTRVPPLHPTIPRHKKKSFV